MKYCISKHHKSEEESLYKVYVTDILRAYAKQCGLNAERYYNLISDKIPQKADKTAENVKEQIIAEYIRLGGG